MRIEMPIKYYTNRIRPDVFRGENHLWRMAREWEIMEKNGKEESSFLSDSPLDLCTQLRIILSIRLVEICFEIFKKKKLCPYNISQCFCLT